MTGITGVNNCPICGGEAWTYLDTETNETDFECRFCGYASYQEINTSKKTGLTRWVETQYLPMSKDGHVAYPKGDHKWNKEDFGAFDFAAGLDSEEGFDFEQGYEQHWDRA